MTEPEFDVGDAWEDEQSGKAYQVKAVEVDYVVQVEQSDEEGNVITSERVRYPQDSLERKVSDDRLSPATAEEDGEEEVDGVECDECGKELATERGLKSHRAQVHGVSEEAETPGE